MPRVRKVSEQPEQVDAIAAGDAVEQETQQDESDAPVEAPADSETVEQEDPVETQETPQYLLDEIYRLLSGAPEGRYTLVPADRAETNQTVKPTGARTADCKMELCEKLF